MFRLVSTLCAAAMAFSLPTSAAAVPAAMPAPSWGESLVSDVQNTIQLRRPTRSQQRAVERARRPDSRPRQAQRRGFYQQQGRGYYNGHRGYRDRRPGYRRHNGWWFPPAAFVAGAIVGGAISGGTSSGNAHVSWCYDRYRSYRASDNTFQPYQGPRRQCISPYS